ncbi:MAG: DUF2815 family protein [Bacteroides sp.]|nr:DUF2815 family protein [Bacteroides sp.]
MGKIFRRQLACKQAVQTQTSVKFGPVRLAFVHLLKPRKFDDRAADDKARYEAVALIPKTEKTTLNAIAAALEAAKQEGLSDKWGGRLPDTWNRCIKDGDTGNYAEYEGFAGHFALSMSSKRRPEIFDLAKNDLTDDSEVYSGIWAMIDANFFAFATKVNKGVSCGLNAVMKVADGPRMGGSGGGTESFDSYDFSDIASETEEDYYDM